MADSALKVARVCIAGKISAFFSSLNQFREYSNVVSLLHCGEGAVRIAGSVSFSPLRSGAR
jgi:hypothetical protein